MRKTKYGTPIPSARELRKQKIRRRLDAIEQHLFRHESEIRTLTEELEQLEVPVVGVVYLKANDQSSIASRSVWNYIDGTTIGLEVGDRVIAPTRYGDQLGLVVAQGRQQDYSGPLSKITVLV
jgi:hypothetical protein